MRIGLRRDDLDLEAGTAVTQAEDNKGKRDERVNLHPVVVEHLRRAFATMNADRLTADALQALMWHKSYRTTQVYINMARQMKAAVEALHMPEALRAKSRSGYEDGSRFARLGIM